MRLEHLPDGSPDCPLIRLYDFTPAEARQLLATVAALASGTARRVEVHRLPFVEAVADCRLTLTVDPRDRAVCRRGPAGFECGFTPDTWDNVGGLIEPFAEGAAGFQWLAGPPGEAALLLSARGDW
jgi:hypothetical protein